MKAVKKNGKKAKDVFDYSFLRGRIVERYGTNRNFACAIGISHVTLSLKLQNRISFRQAEMMKIAELLKLKDEEIRKAFFTPAKERKGGADHEPVR